MYKMKKLQSNTKAYTLDFPVNIFVEFGKCQKHVIFMPINSPSPLDLFLFYFFFIFFGNDCEFSTIAAEALNFAIETCGTPPQRLS